MSSSNNITLTIHGGSGQVYKEAMTNEKDAAYTKALTEAATSGFGVLRKGGSSLDAVETALKILEDSPLFNAGRGAVFNNDEIIELDASIMDGKAMKAGAVAGVRTIKNPVSAARCVLEKSPYVMLTGTGAELFAAENEVEIISPAWFETEERRKQIQQIKQAERSSLFNSKQHHSPIKFGTVGAVALDAQGNLAAATSTGGMLNKKYGRVGDTPIIGAGTYANDTCAISGTGWGEFFICHTVAHDIAALVQYKNLSVVEAADAVISKVANAGGFGGVIVLDANGNISISHNTEGMFWAFIKATGEKKVNVCNMIIE
jgi:beta-aspartyl-peptidase (threonine type)